MRALMKTAPGKGNMEIREIEVPTPGKGEVLIKVQKAGICGSDMHLYDWKSHVTINLPVVCGHEFSGEIFKLGDEVDSCQSGERVVGEPSAVVCGHCFYCNSGNYNLCNRRMILGFGKNGCFGEYVLLPANRIHKIPDILTWEEAAIIEPLACCVHAVSDNLSTRIGDMVVITGPGTIGLMILQLVKLAGSKVAVLGTSSDTKRLEMARLLGADYILDIEKESPTAFVEAITDGLGADTVIECSGAASAAKLCFDLVRKKGQYLQMGLFGKPIEVDLEKVLFKELTVTGSFAQKRKAWEDSIDLMKEKKVNLKKLISNIYPLEDWEKGFEQFRSRDGYKILLSPVK